MLTLWILVRKCVSLFITPLLTLVGDNGGCGPFLHSKSLQEVNLR